MSENNFGVSPNNSAGPVPDNTPDTSIVDTVIDNATGTPTPETPPKQETKAEAKKRIKQLQLKIDGEEFTEDLPFEIDEDQADWYKKTLQLSKKAHKSMQSEANMKSQVDAFVNAMKKDTVKAMEAMGIDPDEFARQRIEEKIKESQMSPEQLKQAELENELKALKAQRDKEIQDRDEREKTLLEKQLYEKIEGQMLNALDKSDLPKERYVIKRIADYMLIGLQNGVEVTAEEIVPIVREEIHAELQHLIKTLGEDKVEDFIGKEVLSKIRKKNVAKSKVVTGASAKTGVDLGGKKVADKAPEKLTVKDFFKF